MCNPTKEQDYAFWTKKEKNWKIIHPNISSTYQLALYQKYESWNPEI